MAAVTYRLLFRTMPLKPTYIQLQMADQTIQEVKGTVTDVRVKIDDHFVYTDFQVIDMGEDEYDPPIILGRPFLSTVKAIIYIGTGEVHMHFPSEKVRRYFTDPNCRCFPPGGLHQRVKLVCVLPFRDGDARKDTNIYPGSGKRRPYVQRGRRVCIILHLSACIGVNTGVV